MSSMGCTAAVIQAIARAGKPMTATAVRTALLHGYALSEINWVLTQGHRRGRLFRHNTRPFSYTVNPDWVPRRSGPKPAPAVPPDRPLDPSLDEDGCLQIHGIVFTPAQTQEIGDFMIARKDDWG